MNSRQDSYKAESSPTDISKAGNWMPITGAVMLKYPEWNPDKYELLGLTSAWNLRDTVLLASSGWLMVTERRRLPKRLRQIAFSLQGAEISSKEGRSEETLRDNSWNKTVDSRNRTRTQKWYKSKDRRGKDKQLEGNKKKKLRKKLNEKSKERKFKNKGSNSHIYGFKKWLYNVTEMSEVTL